MADPQAGLKAFQPQHDFLVCIDSDGCTFDTMEVKHKYCFVVAVLILALTTFASRYLSREKIVTTMTAD